VNLFITLLELVGLAAITYGAWLVFVPAAFIVGGAAGLVIAWRLS